MDVDEFQSKNIFFYVHPLDLTEHGDNLHWNGSFTGEIKKISFEIKPTISTNPPQGVTNFCYDKQLLLDSGVQLALSATSSNSRTSTSNAKAGHVLKNMCQVCKKDIAADKMKGHVGFHILSGSVESGVCGYCGLASCRNKLTKTSKHKDNIYYKVESSCTYFFAHK